MINMDMIGRLNDSTKKMIVYGVGTSPVFVPLLDSIASDLRIKKDSAGVGPSDQTSFYLRNLPVLHFFTGQHSDYHKPTDDVEKINFEGEVQVLAYITKLIEHTFHYPKLGFLKTRSPDTGKSSFKVTLGVMPDYTFEGKGMRIDGVTEGKPAAKAGILAGDVVSALGGETVTDVMSYMKVLSNYKKGDTAKIQIQRKGQSIEMNVTF
jgi:membrane-associated protease RseP (regulator of RpoE activity)